MNRLSLINAAAALTFVLAPFTAHAGEKNEKPVGLQPLITIEMSSEGSFFAPKSVDQIKEITVIDEELEESLVWDKQASN